jgi:hypothetical protein
MENVQHPRTWRWDEDGDTADGSFIRFDSGPTRGFGTKHIAVLKINEEPRSVWILETALYNQIRDEIASRPGKTLLPANVSSSAEGK